MSLGWGKVTVEDWKAAKEAGPGGDVVDPGDYEVTPVTFHEFDPAKSPKGIGAYSMVCQITDNNDPKWVGKKVQAKFQYHPNPSVDNLKQMNAISLQNLVKFVEAANVNPVATPDGMLDAVGTLKQMPALGVRMILSVAHRMEGTKLYQDVGNYRPLS